MNIKLLIISLLLLLGTLANAQSPNLVKFTTSTPDGQYNTGDEIRIEAEFDNWLGLNSEVKVRLNTGDIVTLTFDPEYAEDLIDPTWGISGKVNATLATGHNNTLAYGVYCILELEGKGGHTENKGKMIIAGGFHNYEEYPGGHDMLVVTDYDGKLLQGFGDYNTATDTERFNAEVRWVIETQDGGLLVSGAFTDYGGYANYDYLVKLKYDTSQDKFVIDHTFMNKLTNNNTVQAANNVIPQYVDSWGKPQRAVLQDTDGSIYLAGAFTQVGGKTRRSIAKLDANGNVDDTFDYFSDYSATGATTNLSPGTGYTMSFDPDLEKNGANDLWFGAGRNIYRISKTTGRPTVDVNTSYNIYAHLGQYNVYDRFGGGPNLGTLAITVMPNEDQTDAAGNSGPGGVLVTGRYGTVGGWTCVVAIQDDLTLTPRTKFCLGKTSPTDVVGEDLFTGWGVDGAAFMKGKMWIGLHEPNKAGDGEPTGKNYFEGSLAVLNYDGSMNTQFNRLLANVDDTDNTMSDGTTRPDGNYRLDGIGGESAITINDRNGGGGDVISLFVNSDDDLMVGGSYGSMMQYRDTWNADGTGTDASPDDQIITRLTFKRAVGYYTPSTDDKVPQLEILEIIEHDVSGAFGEGSGTVSLDVIAEEDKFENNHNIGVNMPFTSPDDAFVTTWTVEAGEEFTIPVNTTDYTYKYFVDWGDGKLIGGSRDMNVPNITEHSNTVPATYEYDAAGTYTIKIMCGNDTDSDGFADGTGFPHLFFSNGGDKEKILTVEQWGHMQWKSMKSAFYGCTELTTVPGATAAEAPDLTSTGISFMGMFRSCESFNSNLSGWNVSRGFNFNQMFYYATAFNNGSVTNDGGNELNWTMKDGTHLASGSFSYMFHGAEKFNQKISSWNVSGGSSFGAMFSMTDIFNNGSVTNDGGNELDWTMKDGAHQASGSFSHMFSKSKNFNQNISSWNISKGNDFRVMFQNAELFNNGSVTNDEANELNWTMKDGTHQASGSFRSMFRNAANFNQDISSWNVSQITDMSQMFYEATLFDQNLGDWNISSLGEGTSNYGAAHMLDYCGMSIDNYDNLLIGWQDNYSSKENVQFGAKNVKYCSQQAIIARKNLIDNGWGDGIPSDNSGDYEDIEDGGSGQPNDFSFDVVNIEICEGSSTSLNLSGSELGVSYQLYDAGTDNTVGTAVAGTGNPISFSVTPTAETTYYVIATNSTTSACEKRSGNEITVSLDELSVGGTLSVSGNATVCGGTATLNLSGNTGNVVRWERSTDDFADSANTTTVSTTNTTSHTTATDLSADTYYYRVAVENGVCVEAYANTVTVTVDAAPTADAGSDVTIGSCNSSTAALNGGGTGTTLSYSWTPATGLSDASIANPVANPTSTTIYTLTVTDTYGCTATDQVTVTVDAAPTASAGTEVSIGS
jgi:surface protein